MVGGGHFVIRGHGRRPYPPGLVLGSETEAGRGRGRENTVTVVFSEAGCVRGGAVVVVVVYGNAVIVVVVGKKGY